MSGSGNVSAARIRTSAAMGGAGSARTSVKSAKPSAKEENKIRSFEDVATFLDKVKKVKSWNEFTEEEKRHVRTYAISSRDTYQRMQYMIRRLKREGKPVPYALEMRRDVNKWHFQDAVRTMPANEKKKIGPLNQKQK